MPIIQDNSNPEPTWTTAAGAVIKISSMSDSHLINARQLVYDRCRDNELSMMWYALRNLQEEGIKRGICMLGSVLTERIKKVCAILDKTYPKEKPFNECKLPMKEVEPNPPPIISNPDIAKFIEKKRPDLFVPQKVTEARAKNDKLAQETREINWQNLEAQMLPEGDRDKIVREDLYCDVHRITRRLVQNPINFQFPYFTKVRGANNTSYKKCRITIEVLED